MTSLSAEAGRKESSLTLFYRQMKKSQWSLKFLIVRGTCVPLS